MAVDVLLVGRLRSNRKHRERHDRGDQIDQ
jgi:hypothetical protein